MTKVNTSVHLVSPEGNRVVLMPGDEAPEWADLPESLQVSEPKPTPAKKAPAKKAPAKKKATSKRTST